MLGETVQLADNLWFIRGEMPEDASKAPHWRNVVIYQAADRVYVIDSGGGTAIRASILRVLRELGVVDSFTLINTHGHLDHVCNNDVISLVQAAGKHHYLRQAAIDSVNAGSAYWADQFDFLDPYFDPFTSYQTHRRLYRFVGVLRDGLGTSAGRKRVLGWLFNIQLSKFEPVNESLATMEPLDALPRKALSVKDISWRGWSLGQDDMYVFDDGGHAAGDVLVYIPEHRMLCVGDVTFPLFPTFRDSSRDRILGCLQKSLAMTRNGSVEILADGHGDRCYRGARQVEQLLAGLINDHRDYEKILFEIFENSEGLTPAEVYGGVHTNPRPSGRESLSLD